ncbi:DGQHR domain-containing protein [Pseudolysinimonas sp.]|uniref:DGQHR domain-containing protein n=1 Tax=Pseudolysinimonas sp. TaxID=2680009 RepID=UPI003F7D404D
MANAVERFGSEVTVDHCILGGNLNLSVVRGFARLDLLAAISRPDVYDQVLNPLGTQRMLEKSHATQAVAYAVEALSAPAETDPRAFPEIILNARDRSAVAIFDEQDSVEFEILSTEQQSDDEPRLVKLRFDMEQLATAAIEAPPMISRVDGNHRLSQALPTADEDLDAYPMVPFAIFVGLTADQERAIFRDINGTQKPMQTAHLDTIRLRLEGTGKLLDSEAGRALWLARELSEPGRAFEGKVFFGGSSKGPKAELGVVPPIRINTLKGAIQATMREAQQLEVEFLFNGVAAGTTDDLQEVTEDAANQVLLLLDRYWSAVRKAFPTAWDDRRGFILLQAIGITAFSRLAADVIQEQVFDKQKVQQADFDLVLNTIAEKVSLAREDFPGLAGLSGAKVVYQRLLSAKTQGNINVAAVKQQLLEGLPIEVSPLDE